jgi:hypothetical protein
MSTVGEKTLKKILRALLDGKKIRAKAWTFDSRHWWILVLDPEEHRYKLLDSISGKEVTITSVLDLFSLYDESDWEIMEERETKTNLHAAFSSGKKLRIRTWREGAFWQKSTSGIYDQDGRLVSAEQLASMLFNVHFTLDDWEILEPTLNKEEQDYIKLRDNLMKLAKQAGKVEYFETACPGIGYHIYPCGCCRLSLRPNPNYIDPVECTCDRHREAKCS